MFANPPCQLLSAKPLGGAGAEAADVEAGNGAKRFVQTVFPIRGRNHGVQNRGSSVTIGGSGVPAGQPTGQSSPSHPGAGGLPAEGEGPCQEGSAALERGSISPKVSGHIPNYCNNNN